MFGAFLLANLLLALFLTGCRKPRATTIDDERRFGLPMAQSRFEHREVRGSNPILPLAPAHVRDVRVKLDEETKRVAFDSRRTKAQRLAAYNESLRQYNGRTYVGR